MATVNRTFRPRVFTPMDPDEFKKKWKELDKKYPTNDKPFPNYVSLAELERFENISEELHDYDNLAHHPELLDD